MKKIYLLACSCAICFAAAAQNQLLNGSFESNNATGNLPALSSDWQVHVSDSWEVDAGVMSLLTTDSCGTASDGSWYVASCPNCFAFASYLAFSLKLNPSLVPGDIYEVSFDKKNCGDNTSIDLALTADSTLLGTLLHSFPGPASSSWTHESYVFSAPANASYLAVNASVSMGTSGRIALDNFVLQHASGIGEQSISAVSLSPNPARNFIRLAFHSNGSSRPVLRIRTVTGQTRMESQVSVMAGENVLPVEVSTLARGIYFLSLETNSGAIQKMLAVQ